MNHLRKLLFYLQSGLDREAQNILLGTIPFFFISLSFDREAQDR